MILHSVLQLHHPEWVGENEKQEKAVKDTHCYSNSVLSNFWVLAPALSPDIEDF
jgi:hypothetical protein